MENIRPLHDLYKELYEYWLTINHIDEFVCNSIDVLNTKLIINYSESSALIKHWRKNRPSESLHQEFIEHPKYLKKGDAWWKSGEIEQRDLFLKKMIEITKSENI